MELREQHLTLAARCAEARANWEEALAAKDRAIEQLECALSSKEEALAVGSTSGTATIRPIAYETAPKLWFTFSRTGRRPALLSRVLQSNNTRSPASLVDSPVMYLRAYCQRLWGWWMVGAGDQLRERANHAEVELMHAQSELSALRSADTENVRARSLPRAVLGQHSLLSWSYCRAQPIIGKQLNAYFSPFGVACGQPGAATSLLQGAEHLAIWADEEGMREAQVKRVELQEEMVKELRAALKEECARRQRQEDRHRMQAEAAEETAARAAEASRRAAAEHSRSQVRAHEPSKAEFYTVTQPTAR